MQWCLGQTQLFTHKTKSFGALLCSPGLSLLTFWVLYFKPQEGEMITFLCRRMGCREPSACSAYGPCSHLRAPEHLAASEGTRTALNASLTPSCQDQTKLPGGRSFEIASPWPAWHQGAVSCPLRHHRSSFLTPPGSPSSSSADAT